MWSASADPERPASSLSRNALGPLGRRRFPPLAAAGHFFGGCSVHGSNCPCGACGRRESEWRRTESEAIDQLAHIFDAGLDDFLDESISEACDAVGYDGDRDDDFRSAALRELIGVAVSALFELAGERGRKAAAQAVLRLVAREAASREIVFVARGSA